MKTIQTQGKTALVSGANRGIGKAIVIELLNQGAEKIYAGARSLESLDDLKSTYGDRIIPVQLDVTDDNSIKQASALINNLDILVNNAGVFSVGGVLADTAIDSMKTNLDVNVWGVLKLSNAVLPLLKESKESAIVNISSVAGLGNMPMAGTYSVSKAAVHSMTQGMRAELIENSTLVMGVYPGPIDTDMAAGLEMDKDTPQNVAKSIVDGLREGKEDMYPDVMSVEIGAFYAQNPKGVEKQFGTFA